MTTQELIKKLVHRLSAFKFLILLGGIILGIALFIYARKTPVVYSVRSTVFPLTSAQETSSASSKISELLGGSNGSAKSLTDEATVSIEEVAKSRKTREAVVAEKLPAFGNKRVAELLVEQYNDHLPYFSDPIVPPKSDSDIISLGAALLDNNYNIKFNKNGLLEVTYSGTDQQLLVPVSYLLIDKVSQFYKELKIEKAKADFDFIQKKLDSLNGVLDQYDRRSIVLNNTTLFVPDSKLQYTLPKENLITDKARVLVQKTDAATNREDALWRLQKVTPIIEIMDKPAPPFAALKPSSMVYGISGFLLGCFLTALLSVWGILYRYSAQQIEAALAGKKVDDANVNTTA